MKTILLLCVLLLALGCASVPIPPQIIQLPRPTLPTSYTDTIPIPCPSDQTYEDVIKWAEQLKQIIDRLNEKLEAIQKWEEQ